MIGAFSDAAWTPIALDRRNRSVGPSTCPATLTTQLGRETRNALTFDLDQSTGQVSPRPRPRQGHPRPADGPPRKGRGLLVLDDWGLQGYSAEGRRDPLEIAEARHGRKSILIASQIPVERWPEVIGEPTIADAVLDRIVHNAYRIDLKGESQRKRNRPPPLDGGIDK